MPRQISRSMRTQGYHSTLNRKETPNPGQPGRGGVRGMSPSRRPGPRGSHATRAPGATLTETRVGKARARGDPGCARLCLARGAVEVGGGEGCTAVRTRLPPLHHTQQSVPSVSVSTRGGRRRSPDSSSGQFPGPGVPASGQQTTEAPGSTAPGSLGASSRASVHSRRDSLNTALVRSPPLAALRIQPGRSTEGDSLCNPDCGAAGAPAAKSGPGSRPGSSASNPAS